MEIEAFCLTYDGIQADELPAILSDLERNALRGTFFVNPPTVLHHPDAWRKVSAAGHEIGNGSLHGVTNNGRLPNWTLKMVEQDLHMTNQFLTDFFGTAPCSFAYAGQKSCVADREDYSAVVNEMFSHVRLLPGDFGRAGVPSLDAGDFRLDYPAVLRFTDLAAESASSQHKTICEALSGQPTLLFRELPPA